MERGKERGEAEQKKTWHLARVRLWCGLQLSAQRWNIGQSP